MFNGARLCLSGVNQNRIYKLAQKNGIILKNVEKIDYKTLFFDVCASKIKNMIAICEKNNYNVSIVKRFGLLLIFEVLKQKLGLVIGSLVLVLLSIFSTNFIWRVKIYGVDSTKLNEVELVLNNLNVTPFSFKNDEKIMSAQQEILKEVKGISQVSIMVKGTTILINIKPAVLKEDVLGSE